MDEPFSAVDPITREQLQEELIRLQDEIKKTIVFVTHDMDEALKLGDRIAVMKDGKIIQFETPEQILKNPINEFVEYFVGKDRLWRSPEMLFAQDIMNKRPTGVLGERTPAYALELMREKETEFLVVVDAPSDRPRRMLGVITPRELKGKGTVEHNKMKDLMRTNHPTVSDRTSMVDVLALMKSRKIRNVPVIGEDDGYFKGLITYGSIVNIITDVITDIEDDEGKEVSHEQ
jgi:osmoprotectant transport system ATP-binding protein